MTTTLPQQAHNLKVQLSTQRASITATKDKLDKLLFDYLDESKFLSSLVWEISYHGGGEADSKWPSLAIFTSDELPLTKNPLVRFMDIRDGNERYMHSNYCLKVNAKTRDYLSFVICNNGITISNFSNRCSLDYKKCCSKKKVFADFKYLARRWGLNRFILPNHPYDKEFTLKQVLKELGQ